MPPDPNPPPSTAPASFPVGSRVTLTGLSKAEYNGRVGSVRSPPQPGGRQEVYVEDLSKSFAFKPSNLRYVPRTVDTLSVREMKSVLRRAGGGADKRELAGMDKSQLAEMVRERATPEECAAILAEAAAPVPKPPPAAAAAAASASDLNADQLRSASEQLARMDPESLRAQARALRSMDPGTVRRTNPQMANFTDAQIRAAADQMENMANNPQMMRMAAEHVGKMSPEEMERMRSQISAGGGAAAGGPGAGAVPAAPRGYGTTVAGSGGAATAAPTADQLRTQAEQLSQLTPEQLRQQAEMLRTMDPATLRRMNPQMATMTDEQIRMAAGQFEAMASNPDMVKMAAAQMKNMSPQDVESLRKMQEGMVGGGAGGADPGQLDPSKMLEKMDAKTVKQSIDMMKRNPELVKQMMANNPAAANMSEEQMMKGLEMFGKMDEKQIEAAMGWMKRAQTVYSPLAKAWNAADWLVGGHLGKIVSFGIALLIVRSVFGYFGLSPDKLASSGDGMTAPAPGAFPTAAVLVEDEFEEF